MIVAHRTAMFVSNRPPRGLGGGAARTALGPRHRRRRGARGGDRLGWGHIRILYKAPKDYTKPQQTIQSPQKIYTKTYKIRQQPKTLNKSSNKY